MSLLQNQGSSDMTTECLTSIHTHHVHIYSNHWCCLTQLTEEKVKIGKIHIVALFIFVLHVSLSMEIDVCVDQIFGWTEVNGMECYELLSDVLYTFIELLLNVCTTIIKLFIILMCIIITCIDLFIEILVIYVIQFGSDVLQMLVQELQDLFTLVEAI